ncbi:MAG: signal recognition particle protein [Candidatus Cloacimonas sp. 4484_209]|nr:MAG: signal recognition particle protein [Candidatus Cloacimonas sp. 4484_209]
MFDNITARLGEIFRNLRRKGKLSRSDIEKGLKDIRLALLEADVNYKVVKAFIERLKENATGERVLRSFTPAETLLKVVYEQLSDFLSSGSNAELKVDGRPGVVMLIGLQGSGKTTTAVKIAHLLKKKGKKPLLVPCDLKRPAAVEQLRILSEKAKLSFYNIKKGELSHICLGAVNYAKKEGLTPVILDTAGRLHIDKEMLEELVELKKLLHPREILLVLDAMTGQDAVNIGLEFQKKVDFNGVVLTKMDGDARGGAAFSLKYVTERPIKLMGTGEKIGDIEFFDAQRMASRILGMGDLSTLVEKAQEVIKKEEAEEVARKFREARFTFEDFRKQLEMVKKLGPVEKIAEMIPGMKSIARADIDDKALKRIEAIIGSMTIEERNNPRIIDGSRRKRIARGSGTTVTEVNKLLKDFEMMKKMMKQLSRGKKGFIPGMFPQ